jgi:hypothetical protein
MTRKARTARRSPLVLEEVRERDPEGRIVLHYRVVDTLARMRKAGTIDAPMLAAGREFQRGFILAQLDPLHAVDLLRVPGGGGTSEPTHTQMGARGRVHRALLALGGHDSPAGSCAWHVLGYGCSVREWALRHGWGGRPVRQELAQGLLVAALGLLAVHYGVDHPGGGLIGLQGPGRARRS